MRHNNTKNSLIPFISLVFAGLFIVFGFSSFFGNENQIENIDNQANEVIWNIKAFTHEGMTLDVKAFDKAGKKYDVKAIQKNGQFQFMDIKAFVDGKRLPIKILLSNDRYAPVKAIGEGGIIYDVKAISPEGDKMDVKGIGKSGSIIHIKAIGKDGQYLGVKAISPEGLMNDVKGIKLLNDDIEMMINGIEIYAHIKALPQEGLFSINSIWHVKAITPDGYTLDVKAFDKDGNKFDIKAIQDSDQRQFMDIKAFIGKNKVPVKIIKGTEKYGPVKAIGADGMIYDIKAIDKDGMKLDVKGVERFGNITDIKAIAKDGSFYGVKAISITGQMNDVKGVKVSDDEIELNISGIDVHTHIKAIMQ